MKFVHICLIIATAFALCVSSAQLFSTCGFGFGTSYSTPMRDYKSNSFTHVSLWLSSWSNVNFNKYWEGEAVDYCAKFSCTVVIYGYLIAALGKSHGLSDCDVGSNNLCVEGSNLIRNNWGTILDRYELWSKLFAQHHGTSKAIAWLIEPDFLQYSATGSNISSHGKQNGGGIPDAEMGRKYGEIVSRIKKHLPNAKFGLDISPWMNDSLQTWYSNFNSNDYQFLFTSGGRTVPNNERIRWDGNNNLTWKQASTFAGGKSILADVGYGVGGGNDDSYVNDWMVQSNFQARNNDGVMGVTIARTDAYDINFNKIPGVRTAACNLAQRYTGALIDGDNDDESGKNHTSIISYGFIVIVAIIVAMF